MFIWTKTALWVAASVLAVFGGVGWATALWDKSVPLACLVATVGAIAPFIAAAMTGPAVRGGGPLAWACVLIFVCMDGGSNTNAGWQADSFAMAAINGPAQSAFDADLVSAKANLAAAQAALVALPTPSVSGEITRLATYESVAAILTANLAAAKGELEALTPPTKQHLLPREAMGFVLFLTSFAVIFGFLGVHTAERRADVKSAPVPKPVTKLRAAPRPKPSLRAVVPHDDLVTRMQRA